MREPRAFLILTEARSGGEVAIDPDRILAMWEVDDKQTVVHVEGVELGMAVTERCSEVLTAMQNLYERVLRP